MGAMETTLEGERLIVRLAHPSDADAIVDYYSRNREFFEASSPVRPEDYYGAAYWHERAPIAARELEAGTGAQLFVFSHTNPDQVIGNVSLFGVIRGSFHAGILGYALDERMNGHGLMTEALRLVLDFAFGEFHLHRVMANHAVTNERSARVLRRLGFLVEGYAREYLLIQGRWVDHYMTCLINPEWTSRNTPSPVRV